MGGGILTLITGERGIFQIYKSLENDPNFKVVPKESHKLNSNVMEYFNSIHLEYKNNKIEVFISSYQDNRTYNKAFHPNGGLEASYECLLIQH